MPEVAPVQDAPTAPPPSKADEDSKIRALIDTPALDWQWWDGIFTFYDFTLVNGGFWVHEMKFFLAVFSLCIWNCSQNPDSFGGGRGFGRGMGGRSGGRGFGMFLNTSLSIWYDNLYCMKNQ